MSEREKLWDSPVYRFRLPRGENPEEPTAFEEVVIDVTGSAPSFNKPSEELKTILHELFTSPDYQTIDTVMEFGAAKLKNIPFILEQGKTVCAVEFEKLTTNEHTLKNIKKCNKFGAKFKNVQFPNPFILDDAQYDLLLLLNVVPVMPVLAERMYLLDLLYSRVKNNKYLLWIAQKEGSGPNSYKEMRESGMQVCGDGIWVGIKKKVKTFYKYHSPVELDEMMGLYGFTLVKKFSHGGSDARLYQKNRYNLFNNLISPDTILNKIPFDSTILDPVNVKLKRITSEDDVNIIIPNPRSLSIESLYIEKIKSIPTGVDNEEYQRIVSYALGKIFKGSLTGMEFKQEIHEGVGIIDTVFTNQAKTGFFNTMAERYASTFPILEMKNYSTDVGPPEVDQLNGRFSTNRGNFGLLVCRKIENRARLLRLCAAKLPNNCILFLTDVDLIDMLNHSRTGAVDDIDAIMNNKLRELLLGNA